jgi:hypothetical protein
MRMSMAADTGGGGMKKGKGEHFTWTQTDDQVEVGYHCQPTAQHWYSPLVHVARRMVHGP